jgi:hypothetical protein
MILTNASIFNAISYIRRSTCNSRTWTINNKRRYTPDIVDDRYILYYKIKMANIYNITTKGRENPNPMYIKNILLLTTVILSYCSIVHADEDRSLNLRTGEVHESCHKLDDGVKLSYSFESSSPALFNIHYHQGKEIIYPVAEQIMMSNEGTLSADSMQTYCLMWTNPQSQTLTLRYKVELPVN